MSKEQIIEALTKRLDRLEQCPLPHEPWEEGLTQRIATRILNRFLERVAEVRPTDWMPLAEEKGGQEILREVLREGKWRQIEDFVRLRYVGDEIQVRWGGHFD